MATPNPSSPESSPPYVPHNPAPLSSAQEQQVRELYHKRVRTKCADEIRGRYRVLLSPTFSSPSRPPRIAPRIVSARSLTQPTYTLPSTPTNN
ncbi:hypothetical protein EV356DRAFT_503089 [Viridothelium virens]|uniref:Uncharacterized protein n=1 Tax=Viridothelium virens TaxID=1048519 RepID=A0A6A6H774_VIRVR|nr:hypothetical protein EV356DRAFT_503089 [Viridothelium virens]